MFSSNSQSKPPVTITISTSTISDKTEKPDVWELDSSKLKITDFLGEGEFGVVRKGLYKNADGNHLEVAIKMLRGKFVGCIFEFLTLKITKLQIYFTEIKTGDF